MVGVKSVKKAVREKMEGGRPSRARSSVSAAVAGTAVAVSVYKVLRNG